MQNTPPKRPVRFFNTTGPCFPWDHYMLPPAERLIGAQLDRYIRDKLYWVLHAPRQTGKTTFLQNWTREINAGNETAACYVTIESCQGITDTNSAMKTINISICAFSKFAGLPVPELPFDDTENLLFKTLQKWAELVAQKQLVVLFDESDVLEGNVLISFLRQLRSGFADRAAGKFPVSIALAGLRDLKDYITQAKNGVPVNPGSPFNIKEDSATIRNFSRENVEHLFAQRTEETGQLIAAKALEYVWDQSRGQPWIVNNLFQRATMRILKEDNYETVTLEHIMQAREQMILARETHLDSLVYRLDNPGVKKIMESIISGRADPTLAENDSFRLCLDLGLVVLEKGTPSVANPIYREVIARQITYGPQLAIAEPEWQWEKPDGSLDMDTLLREFQKFWRKNSEIWEQKSDYSEAFPHLLIMAFLQRVLNGGGRIDREYAAGRGRMDLAVEYKKRFYIIEVKLVHSHDSPDEIYEEGITQIIKYRNSIDSKAPAYLVIFDRRESAKNLPWDERIKWHQDAAAAVTVLGC